MGDDSLHEIEAQNPSNYSDQGCKRDGRDRDTKISWNNKKYREIYFAKLAGQNGMGSQQKNCGTQIKILNGTGLSRPFYIPGVNHQHHQISPSDH